MTNHHASCTELLMLRRSEVTDTPSLNTIEKGLVLLSEVIGTEIFDVVKKINKNIKKGNIVKASMLCDTALWLYGANTNRDMSPSTWALLANNNDNDYEMPEHYMNTVRTLLIAAESSINVKVPLLGVLWIQKDGGFDDMLCTMHVLTQS